MADTTVEVEVPALVVAQVEVPAPIVVQIEVRTGAPGPPGAVIDLTEDVDGAITAAIDALVDASPAALDTLNELAAALGDDPNFATTVNAALAANATAIAAETTRAVAAETVGRRLPPETPARLEARAASTRAWALADTLALSGYSPFLAYCNSIGTNLNVLHRYDEPSGTSTADRRAGQIARTGTFTTGAGGRGFDTSLDRGSSKAAGAGLSTTGVTVNNYTGDTGGPLTYAMVVRFSRFHSTYFLVDGTGSNGVSVVTTDEGSGAKIRVLANTLTVATSTVTISDTWKDHLILVSMGATTASTRIVIDGVECTGTITSRTLFAASTRFLTYGPAAEPLYLSAYAEWARQLSPTEEAGLLSACQFSYKPRVMLHGIHSGLDYYPTNVHQAVVNATFTNLRPQMARLELRWAQVQSTNGGAYDWSALDSAVDKFLAAGIEPLVTIMGSPTWATGGANEFAIPAPAGYAAWLTAYTTFVTAAATHYLGRVRYWELWNEPNYGNYNTGFWQPMDTHSTKTATTGVTLTLADASGFPSSGSGSINSPAVGFSDFAYTGKTGNQLTGVTTSDTGMSSYPNGSVVSLNTSVQWGANFAAMCNAWRAAILAVDQTAKVCTGGTAGWGYGGEGISGLRLTAQAFAAGLAQFDHYGIHPYPSNDVGPRLVADFQNAFAGIRVLRDFLIANGRSASTVWATEFGWFFPWDNAALSTTGTYMSQAFYDLLNYYSGFTDLFCYFLDYDRGTTFYGLMDSAYVPKSTATIFRDYATDGAAQPEPAPVIPVPPTAVPDPYDIDGGTG